MLKVISLFVPVLFCLFSLKINAQVYCTPNVLLVQPGVGISNVSLSNLNYTSIAGEGYQNYTIMADTANLYRGGIYTFSMTVETDMQEGAAWIDWNDDGDFYDADETIFFQGGLPNGTPSTLNISVPASAALGFIRMRVATNENSFGLDPCNTTQFTGDIEDYTILIGDTNMEFYDATTSQNVPKCVVPGTANARIIGIEITTQYTLNPISITQLDITTVGTSNLSDISNAKIWYTGSNSYFDTSAQFSSTIASPGVSFSFVGSQILLSGKNYFWLSYDVNASATLNNLLDASCSSVTVGGSSEIPNIISPEGNREIISQCFSKSNRADAWYFGRYAGMSFKEGCPFYLEDSKMNQGEGNASMADEDGNLLFYTNGSTVWNNKHDTMLGGSNILGGFTNISAMQSALIAPQPGTNNIYYIFTPTQENGTNGFTYSVVDINGDGGLGQVISSNTQLHTTTCEKVAAVYHCNREDIWIISHKYFSDSFYVYLLTKSGITNTVISKIGKLYTHVTPPFSGSGSSMTRGSVKVSPDGSKIVSRNSGVIDPLPELFDFDPATGIISNKIQLPLNGSSASGLAFSSDSKKLFVFENNYVYQYDLTINDSATIVNSKVLIDSTIIGWYNSAQLAPDGKIYVGRGGGSNRKDTLAVINLPNATGTAVNFIERGFYLGGGGKGASLSLPAIMASYLKDCNIIDPLISADFIADVVCLGDSTSFRDTSVYYSDCPEWRWYFDDPASGTNDSSNLENPKHVFTNGGEYLVTMILKDLGQRDTIIKTVYVLSDTSVLLPDTTICLGDTVQVFVSDIAGVTYQWMPLIGINNDVIYNPMLYPDTTTNYKIFISNGICTDTFFENIIVKEIIVNVSSDTNMCLGDTLLIYAGGNANKYSWTPISSLSNTFDSVTMAYPITTTNYIVNAIDTQTGCSVFDSILITVNNITAMIVGDTFLCDAVITELKASQLYDHYQWSTGDTTNNIVITDTGLYWLIATLNDCVDTASTLVHPCPRIFIPNSFSPNKDGNNDVFLIRGEGIASIDIKVYDRWGSKVFESLNHNTGWNGEINGKLANEGVYVYVISGILIDDTTIDLKGNVTLVQ